MTARPQGVAKIHNDSTHSRKMEMISVLRLPRRRKGVYPTIIPLERRGGVLLSSLKEATHPPAPD